jgi:hypothetical protein
VDDDYGDDDDDDNDDLLRVFCTCYTESTKVKWGAMESSAHMSAKFPSL